MIAGRAFFPYAVYRVGCNMTDIQFTMIPCRNQLGPEVWEVWDRLYHHCPAAPIFHHPEWTEIATRTGHVTDLTGIIYFVHKRPFALLPIRRRTAWTAEIVAPAAVEYPVWLVDPVDEEAAWTGLSQWFKRASHLQLLSLGRYSDQERVARYVHYAAQHGLAICSQPVEPVNVLSLPASWQEFLKTLAKSTRGNLHNTENRLRRDFPDLSIAIFTAADPWEDAMNTLMHHAYLRWQHHAINIFAQSQQRVYFRETMRWAVNAGYAAIHVLRVNGIQIAAATVLRHPRQDLAHYYLVGRDAGPAYQHYRAGIVLLSHIIRWSIDQGLRELHMGQGRFDYKAQLGADEQPLWELYLAHSPQQAHYWRKIDAAIQLARSMPGAIRSRLPRKAALESGEAIRA